MSRLNDTFAKLNATGKTALVGFISAGDPDIRTSLNIVGAMFDGGLDILELGVSFSDPTADGDTIQRSSARALKAGITLARVITMVREIRISREQPIIIFSYINPVYHYGYEKFVRDAVDAGADGVLLVDMPFEEAGEFKQARDCVCTGNDFALINIIAPTTKGVRLKAIADGSEGFIYMINRMGITGAGGVDAGAIKANAARIKPLTDVPVCMGFGVSSPQDVEAIAAAGDGVVVGSLFEKTIEENIGLPELPAIVGKIVRELKAPIA
ncbi:MAG: tryptophan synthase subunit alpha [Phycisphaerae bacterium]